MTDSDVLKIGSKYVSIPHMTDWLIEELSRKTILKSDELFDRWGLDESAMRKVFSRIDRKDILFSNGNVVSTQAIIDWVSKQIIGGVISIDEALDEWLIQRSHMMELISCVSLEKGIATIPNLSGELLTLSYLERRLVNLIESSKKPLSIQDLSSALHISTDNLQDVLGSISSVVLNGSSQIVAIGEIKYRIASSFTRESNPPSYRGVDPKQLAESFDLHLDVIKSIASELPETSIENKHGRLVLFLPLLSELRTIVDNEGRADISKFLTERDFGTDVEAMLLKGITKPFLITSNGVLVLEEWISSKIIEMAYNKGLVDLKKLSETLDVPFDDIIRIAKEAMPKDIRLVDDEKTGKPSAVYNTKWLSELESRLLVEGSVKILGLAKSLAVPIKLLESVLTRATGGLVDRDFEVFRLRDPTDRKLVTTAEPQTYLEKIKIQRGGEWVGSEFRYKVKVWNDSENVITDVIVTIMAFPDDALSIQSETTKRVPKIDPGGFRSPEFRFSPTQDCVKGEVLASVNYIDHKGKPHSMTTEPLEIKAVCDLLNPEQLTTKEFLLQSAQMPRNEEIMSITGFGGDELVEYIRNALESSNFSIVSISEDIDEQGKVYSVIGWARGKYTKRGVGVHVRVHPGTGKRPAQVDVNVVGEDKAMLAPVQEELGIRIDPWNCPYCRARLEIGTVASLRASKPVECPNCGHVLTQSGYRE